MRTVGFGKGGGGGGVWECFVNRVLLIYYQCMFSGLTASIHTTSTCGTDCIVILEHHQKRGVRDEAQYLQKVLEHRIARNTYTEERLVAFLCFFKYLTQRGS